MQKGDAYRWTAVLDDPAPDWVIAALADRDIRRDGDGDAFVLTNDGPKKLIVGDYVMRDPAGGLCVVAARIYEALTGVPSDMHPFTDANRPDPFQHVTDMMEKQKAAEEAANAPPHSSAVAARSAKARAENAEWEAKRNVPPHIGLSKPRLPPGVDPYNAAHEGAHVGEPEADARAPTGTSDT